MISVGMSSKILKEALIQQKEIHEEAEGPNSNKNAFVFEEEDRNKRKVEEDEDDIDEFAGFNETQSQFGNYEVSVLYIYISYKKNVGKDFVIIQKL